MSEYIDFETYDGRLCLLSEKELRHGLARGKRQAQGEKKYKISMNQELRKIRSLIPRFSQRLPLKTKERD